MAHPPSPGEAHDPAAIVSRQFATARRGLDSGEVRAYLYELSRTIGDLQRRAAELESRAQQAESRAVDAERLDEDRLVELLGEETTRVLATSRGAAADIKNKAQESAARLISQANDEAHQIRSDAESAVAKQRGAMMAEVEALRREASGELERRRAEADEIAAQMVREAESGVEALRRAGDQDRREATDDANAIRARAQEEGQQLVAEAQLVRERMLRDLARRRRAAREQLERLHAARDRLLAAYEVVRRTVAEATTELQVALPEAKIAGDQAMRRVHDEAEPTVDELEAQVSMARIAGLLDPLQPIDRPEIGADEAHPGPVVSGDDDLAVAPVPDLAESAGADDTGEQRHDRGDESTESTESDDADGQVDESESAGGAAGGDAPEAPAVRETQELDATWDAELDEPHDDEPAEGEPHDDEPAEDEPGEGEPGEPDAWPPDVPAAAPEPEDAQPAPDLDELFARLRQGQSEDADDAGGSDDADADDAGGSDDADADDAGGSDDADAGADLESVLVGAVAETRPVNGNTADGVVTARAVARSGRASTSEDRREHEVGQQATADDHAEVDHESDRAGGDDRDAGPLRRRDEALRTIEHDLARLLKRALADEQNEVLDLLRRTKPASVDELFAGVADHAERYADAARDELEAAANCGAIHLADAQEPQSEGFCDALAAELGQAIVEPLRERVARSFVETGGDLGEVTDRLRALYREWKGQRIADAVRHYSVVAYTQGAYAAFPEGAALRWLVDRHGDPCPDADDNALAGLVCKGEAFPTGDRCPPAHLGCRCLVVTAEA